MKEKIIFQRCARRNQDAMVKIEVISVNGDTAIEKHTCTVCGDVTLVEVFSDEYLARETFLQEYY